MAMNKHTYSHFDTELETLEKRVLMLGEVVCEQVERAMYAMSNNDLDLVEDVLRTEKSVNREEVAIDEMSIHMIARHAPTAIDLRQLMSVRQLVSDLERVGDEAKKIVKAARPIIESDSRFVPKVELQYVSAIAVSMLRSALDAYVRRDVDATVEILRKDKEVDAIFKGIVRQLATFMMEDPRLITHALDVLFIAKSIERVGDHATNIAEQVVYLVKGRDVRHDTPEQVEEKIAK